MTRTAHCSCGALRVEVSADPDAVIACDCGECQRRTGRCSALVHRANNETSAKRLSWIGSGDGGALSVAVLGAETCRPRRR
jgi:hypothetical protein